MSVVVGSQPTFDPGGVEPRPPSVGSMSSSSPELVREDLLEAWPVKCAYVVSEILQTEEAYLQALDDIIQVRVCACVCVCVCVCVGGGGGGQSCGLGYSTACSDEMAIAAVISPTPIHVCLLC